MSHAPPPESCPFAPDLPQIKREFGALGEHVDELARRVDQGATELAAIRSEIKGTLWRAAAVVVMAEPVVRAVVEAVLARAAGM